MRWATANSVLSSKAVDRLWLGLGSQPSPWVTTRFSVCNILPTWELMLLYETLGTVKIILSYLGDNECPMEYHDYHSLNHPLRGEFVSNQTSGHVCKTLNRIPQPRPSCFCTRWAAISIKFIALGYVHKAKTVNSQSSWVMVYA